MFPSGTIENMDKIPDRNYIEAALFREINEEFQSKIKINTYDYLGVVKLDSIKIIFYIFIITNWEGKFPNIFIEPNELDSNIAFYDLIKSKEVLFKNNAKETYNLILDYINKNNI